MGKQFQAGFAAVEAVLIIIIVAIVTGTGWYVWHGKQMTEVTLTNTAASQPAIQQKSVKSITPVHANGSKSKDTATPKYLVIKEWNVKFSYNGSDTYSYRLPNGANGIAEIISAQLASNYPGCDSFGAGIITRGLAADPYTEGPGDSAAPTYQDEYKQNPSLFGKAGSYYYAFHHDQAACANNANDASNAAQNAASAAVATIVPSAVLAE